MEGLAAFLALRSAERDKRRLESAVESTAEEKVKIARVEAEQKAGEAELSGGSDTIKKR